MLILNSNTLPSLQFIQNSDAHENQHLLKFSLKERWLRLILWHYHSPLHSAMALFALTERLRKRLRKTVFS